MRSIAGNQCAAGEDVMQPCRSDGVTNLFGLTSLVKTRAQTVWTRNVGDDHHYIAAPANDNLDKEAQCLNVSTTHFDH